MATMWEHMEMAKIMIKILRNRFGPFLLRRENHIRNLSEAQLNKFIEDAWGFEKVEDLEVWLSQHPIE